MGGGDNTDELDNDAGSDDAEDIVVVRELFVRHSNSPIPRSSRVGLMLEVVGNAYTNFPPN